MATSKKKRSGPRDGWEEVRAAEREQNAAHIRVHEARAAKFAAKAAMRTPSPNVAANPTQEQVDASIEEDERLVATFVQSKVGLLLAKAEEQRAMAKHDIARDSYYGVNRIGLRMRRRRISKAKPITKKTKAQATTKARTKKEA
jgi:hypothetical protein